MHTLNDLVPTVVQLQNTAAWMLLVLAVVAALLLVWYAVGRLQEPAGDDTPEEWRAAWADAQREVRRAAKGSRGQSPKRP